MSHTPHDLSEEFPGNAEKIQLLKQSNAHFAKLVARYGEINAEVHRAETDIAPTDDVHITDMRKERLAIKDAIAAVLRAD
jgi:uncharacterized protein YdcH (DUF465 family)